MSMDTSLRSLKTAITAGGYEYAYNVFPLDDGAPAFPYLTAVVTNGTASLFADDINYYDTMYVELSLFTKEKQPATEDAVRAILKGLELDYEWTENYVETQKFYQIIYRFTMDA